jgi:hypothetical protein
MPTSKKRGGAKKHRAKIDSRNKVAKAQQNAMQKMFTESMKAQIEELKKKAEAESGTTEN